MLVQTPRQTLTERAHGTSAFATEEEIRLAKRNAIKRGIKAAQEKRDSMPRETYDERWHLSYVLIKRAGFLTPGFDPDIANYFVRQGTDASGKLSWGIYERESNSRVASFMPNLPRVISTIQELYNAAADNKRSFKAGKVEQLSTRQLRENLDGEMKGRTCEPLQ